MGIPKIRKTASKSHCVASQENLERRCVVLGGVHASRHSYRIVLGANENKRLVDNSCGKVWSFWLARATKEGQSLLAAVKRRKRKGTNWAKPDTRNCKHDCIYEVQIRWDNMRQTGETLSSRSIRAATQQECPTMFFGHGFVFFFLFPDRYCCFLFSSSIKLADNSRAIRLGLYHCHPAERLPDQSETFINGNACGIFLDIFLAW